MENFSATDPGFPKREHQPHREDSNFPENRMKMKIIDLKVHGPCAIPQIITVFSGEANGRKNNFMCKFVFIRCEDLPSSFRIQDVSNSPVFPIKQTDVIFVNELC